ncbi:MAG TPA: aminoglycoside phosphotransferase family protein [Gaiellaceae bacterium]
MEKAAITPDLVSELVRTQFPQWAHLPVRPVELDGWDNTTFRLGDSMSVRLPSADVYSAQVEKEQRWLPVLAPRLPLPVPTPVAKGLPGCGFPRPWSVYAWLDGVHATAERVGDLERFAVDLAGFLTALYAIDPAGGPPPGQHNFLRGGPVDVYDDETRAAIVVLSDEIDGGAAADVWEAALEATWHGPPVWVHGDVAASNLLVADGLLVGVVDFGCSAVGDPACDVAIAWTFLVGESRAAFRGRLALDDATWARGRGWALWKALITHQQPGADAAARRFGWRVSAREVVEDVIADHRAARA